MKNLKISAKLLIGYIIVIILTLIVGAVGIFGLRRIDGSYSQAYINTTLPLPLITNAIEELTDVGVHARDVIIYANDPSCLQESIIGSGDAMSNFESYLEKYQLTISNPDTQEAFYKAMDAYKNNYEPAVQQVIALTQAGDQAGAIQMLTDAKAVRLTVSENLRLCLQYDYVEGEKNSASNTALARTLIYFLIVVIILAAIASIIIALYLSNIISKPVIFMKDVLSRIGLKGDLDFSEEEYSKTAEYASYKDEVGQSIGMLLTTVLRLVEVGKSLEMVSSGNFSSDLVALSEKDVMCLSLQKMVDTLSSTFQELEQRTAALKQARDLAIQNSHYKSEFLSRMSHEIRTPMNAIIGMTSLGKNADNIERKDYCLDKIDSASMHLLGVINDVLDMSKIEAGKLELSQTEFALEKMLIKITNIINFRMEEKEQSFYIKVDPNVPRSIVSDEQRLSQVITNLLSNSNKFTPEEGAVSLFVRRLDNDDDFCTLEFEVTDNGIGISEEQQKKLFQPFEQANGSISRKFGGTGLGLVISKRIIEMMGGNIQVKSDIGKGSSFIFTIRTEIGKMIPRTPPTFNINWDNLRVLAVDDDNNAREFFTHMVDTYKINCEVAAGGKEALELMDHHDPFNIVFVDWKMPEMDGIALTRRIKERYGESSVVIMISAMEWSTIEPEARQAGVDGFISKPLFGSLIVDCINEYLTPQQVSADKGNSSDAGCFLGKHILLAEDVEINREIVIATLEHTGIQIDCAENGQVAYGMFKDNPDYDLIFMDIHMPEVDGYAATKMIRALDHPQAKTVPIIAMTASVFKEDIERCLAAGMNSHVGKPLELSAIIETLKNYLTPTR